LTFLTDSALFRKMFSENNIGPCFQHSDALHSAFVALSSTPILMTRLLLHDLTVTPSFTINMGDSSSNELTLDGLSISLPHTRPDFHWITSEWSWSRASDATIWH
jgi:hypothetical protein